LWFWSNGHFCVGELAKKWAPAYENYAFEAINGGTGVAIEQDIAAEERASFEKMWPEALALLKNLCER